MVYSTAALAGTLRLHKKAVLCSASNSVLASTVGNFLNLDAVIGVVIAIIFLKEKIAVWQLAGGLLVLV